MANNQYINKVVYGNQVLLDLTSDTIEADKLLRGYTAHKANGEPIVGTYEGGGEGYTINLTASSSELYGQDIVVSYEGQRVTTIQFSNDGTASITVQEEGAYNFAVSYGGLTYYCDVNVVSAIVTYNETIYYYPNGSTVTPTDDIQIWLHCANIWNKTYTTLSEVLNDSACLSSLIADSNAVDYLVRSKSFAKSEALVPAMTDDTHPSGECFASDLTVNPYRAFDENNSTVWYASTGSVVNQYVGYKFPSSKRIGRVKGTAYINTSSSRTYTVKVQGSNDGFSSDIHDLTNPFTYSGTSSDTVNINQAITDIGNYESYRLFCTAVSDSTGTRYGFKELQFYTEDGLCDNATAMSYIGLNNYASNTLLANDTWCKAILLSDYVESVMNVKMPPTFMTGYSTPAGNGTVYGSSVGTSNGSPYYYPWKAFDGVISSDSGWENSPSDTVPVYLGYKLPSAKCIKGMTFRNVRSYGAKDFTVQGSNDSSESTGFTDIKSFEIAETTSKQAFPFGANITDYSNIRLYFTSLYNSPTNKCAHATEIKFYGRVDV